MVKHREIKTTNRRKVLCIPLLGKGATNHLHKQALADSFMEQDIELLFLVREDYETLLKRLLGCRYLPYRIPEFKGWSGKALGFLRSFRRLYPATDPWRRFFYETSLKTISRLHGRIGIRVIYQLSRFRFLMKAAAFLEGVLYRMIQEYNDLDSLDIDALLVMSVGSWAQPFDSRLTWWAYHRGLPVVHIVGNYDSLSSNGFRGFPVQKLFIWGDQMREDAYRRHDIPRDRVHPIGALRYNLLPDRESLSRDSFLWSIGFDPSAKTIVFGGSSYEYHYFEFFSAYRILKERLDTPLQLIIRVYPNKTLLDSAYLQILMDYAATQSDVWVSVGDPNFRERQSDTDVIVIDEDGLWKILNAADVVINLFSTLALEACIFDKPVIHMWYFLPMPRVLLQPVYYPSHDALHNRRAVDSGAVVVARSREELVNAIIRALNQPSELSIQRRKYVEHECGTLDGKALQRLVDLYVSHLRYESS